MKDEAKTKEQLISELMELRQRVAGLEAVDTERVRVVEILQEREELYRSLMGNTYFGITLVDVNYKILMVNAAIVRNFRKPAGEFVGRECFREFEKRESVCAHCPGTRAMATGQSAEVETEGVRDDGSRFSARIQAFPTIGLDGTVTGFIEIVEDITERKRTEEAFRQRTAQLEALREVGLEFTAQLNLDDLLRSIVSRAVELLGGNSGAIDLYRPELDMLEWGVSVGMDHPSLRQASVQASEPLLRRGEGLCGKVWESGEPLIVDDYHRWEGRVPGWEGYPFQAVMGVPVRWGEEFLGVLQVSAAPPRTFSPADAELLSLFAHQAAIAIRNARLYEQARKLAERLTVVNRIARVVGTTLDLDDLMETVYREVTSVFEADAFFIALYDEKANELDYRLRVDEGTRVPPERRSIGTGLTSLVVAEKKPLLIRDWEREQDRLPTPRVWGTMKLPASWLGVPMLIGERLVGVISVQAYRPHTYGEEEQQLLSTIADQVAVAVENARLYEQTQQQSERLAQTLAISEYLHRGLELQQVLEHIAQGTVRLGFRRAVINVCQPGEELVRARATAGLEEPEREALMEATYRWSDFQALMREQFRISRSYLIRHEEMDWDRDFRGVVVTPNLEDRGPGYWHPEDMLLVPLWGSRGEPVGLLSADEPVDGLLPDLNTIQTLEAFANQAAIAIQNARLFEAEKRRATQLALINEVGDQAASILDLDRLMQEVTRSIQESFNYYNVALVLVDEERHEVVLRAVAGGFEHIAPGEYRQSLDEGIVGFVARTGQSWLARDINNDPHYVKGFLGEVLTRSELCVPIKLGDKVIGALDLQSIRLNDFDQLDVVAMEAVADRLAIAIQNARLYEETKRRAGEMMALHETTLDITSQLEMQSLLNAIIARASDLLGATGGLVHLYDPTKEKLVAVTSYNLERDYTGLTLGVGEGVAGKVFQTGEPLIIDDHSAWAGKAPQVKDAFARSIIGVPLRWKEQAIGVLDIMDNVRVGAFDEQDLRLLMLFADQAAIAIQNAQLYEKVERSLEQLTALRQTSLDITARLDITTLLEAILQRATELLRAKGGGIYLYDPTRQELKVAVDCGLKRSVVGTTLKLGEGLSGRVAQTGEPMIVDDYRTWPGRSKQYDEDLFTAVVEVPLKWQDQVIGTIAIIDDIEEKGFTEEDAQLLSFFADQAAIAIQNARLFEETQRRARQLQTVEEVGRKASAILDLDELFPYVVKAIQQNFGYYHVDILLEDQATGYLVFRASSDAAVEKVWREQDLRFKIGEEGLIGWVAHTGQPLLANDVSQEPRYLPDELLPETKSELVVPLKVGEQVVGVLDVDSDKLNAFDEDDVFALQTLANQIAIAIENARLYEAEQRRRQEAETLRQTALALTSALDRNQVVGRILTQLQQVVPYDSASVQLLQGDRLVIIGGRGFPNLEELRGVSFPVDSDNPNREVMRTLAPFIVEDAPAVYEGFRHGPHLQTVIRSWLGVPMLIGQRPVGMIALDKSEPGFYTEEHARLAQTFAAQSAIAIENARLYYESQRRAEEMAALREVNVATLSTLERDQVFEIMLDQLGTVIDYDTAAIKIITPDGRDQMMAGRGPVIYDQAMWNGFDVRDNKLVQEMRKTRRPVVIHDTHTDERYERIGDWQPFRSWLGAPLFVRGDLIGYLAVEKTPPGFYDENTIKLLGDFAYAAAIALENVRLFEEVEKRRVYLEGVLGSAPDAIVTLDAHQRIVEWNKGAERLFRYSRQEVIGQNIDDLVTSPDVLEEAVGFTRMAMSGKEVPPTETVRYRKDGSPVDVILAGSPILVGEEFIGAVAVYTDITVRKRMEEELRAMALLDDLTGLHNRRGFFTLAGQQLKTADRMKWRMLLLFADFNGLKWINDTFGHPAGDQALIEVAEVLRETFRESDIIARIAGDEFVVLALETDGDSAEIIVARLQGNLEARNARPGRRYKLSLSMGVARYAPESPCSTEELVARADRAMYEQKEKRQWIVPLN